MKATKLTRELDQIRMLAEGKRTPQQKHRRAMKEGEIRSGGQTEAVHPDIADEPDAPRMLALFKSAEETLGAVRRETESLKTHFAMAIGMANSFKRGEVKKSVFDLSKRFKALDVEIQGLQGYVTELSKMFGG